MKNFILVAVVAMFIGGGTWPSSAETVTIPAEPKAHNHGHDVTVHDKTPILKDLDQPVFGVKADAPNLIQITKTLHAGLEAGKDLHKTDANEGWFAFAKVTYTGCWFNCK